MEKNKLILQDEHNVRLAALKCIRAKTQNIWSDRIINSMQTTSITFCYNTIRRSVRNSRTASDRNAKLRGFAAPKTSSCVKNMEDNRLKISMDIGYRLQLKNKQKCLPRLT